MKKLTKNILNRHTILITILVYVIMTVSSWIPFNFKALNPFKKSLSDYDATDIVFSQFKEKNSVFDDRIVLVNVGRPDRMEIDSMLTIIQKYEPKVVGVDIHFEDFNESKVDSSLRKTLMDFDNVMLVKRLSGYDQETDSYFDLEGCHPFFCDSIPVAYTNFYARPDMTIRQFSPSEMVNGKRYYSLGTAMAIHGNATLKAKVLSRKNVETINYIGDRDAFINLEKTQILSQNQDLKIK